MVEKNAVLELLGELIKIESPYFKEKEVLDYIHNWFSDKGIESYIHSYSEPIVTKFDGENVIVELKGSEPGPHIYFNAHVDTVYISSGPWEHEPLEPTLVGDKLYGLGALDMKSGVAAVMLALDVFNRRKSDFKGKITAHFVSDEEGPFGLGTTFIIKHGLVGNPDFAIITEPSSGFTDMPFPVVCLGARGGYNYTVRLYGHSAHAGTPELGQSAVIDASRLMIELENIDLPEVKNLGKGSSVVIRMAGGGAACSVPDYAEVEVFRHSVPGENMASIREEVEEAIGRAKIKSDYEIEFRGSPAEGFDGGFDAYYYENNLYIDSFVDSIQDVCKKEPAKTFFASIGDFNHIGGKLGIPTVIFGAAGKNFHSPNEYVEVSTVVDTANTILNFLEKTLAI